MRFSEENKPILPLDYPAGFSKSVFDELLYASYLLGASDISIQTGDYVVFSISGRQIRASNRTIQMDEIGMMTNTIYGGANGESLITQGSPIDKRYEIVPFRGERVGFRVHILPARVNGNDRSISITLRVLPKNPPVIFSQGVPHEVVVNSLPKNGLVVVAGVTSSGKSTLIAGLLRYAYEIKEDNLVTESGRKIGTYEAPIEYVYDGIESFAPKISQTEVGGIDTGIESWALAVKTAMRRALSVVQIGECRDGETINGCIEMALTGHLTLTTVHANKVGVAFRRMVAMAAELGGGNDAVAERLLGSLSLIVVQTLAPKIGGGRIAIREWLPFTQGLQEKLFNVQYVLIGSEIQKMVNQRKTSMGHSALYAYKKGLITLNTACTYSGLKQNELLSLDLDENVFKEFDENLVVNRE